VRRKKLEIMIGVFTVAVIAAFVVLAAIGAAEHRQNDDEKLADGLFAVVQKFIGETPELNENNRYFVIEYETIPGNAGARLKEKFEAWLTEFNDGDIETDYNTLLGRGAIPEIEGNPVDAEFDAMGGFVLRLSNISLKDSSLSVSAGFWRGPLWGRWAEYSARYVSGVWIVDEPENEILS
jgi:hypothetical protein